MSADTLQPFKSHESDVPRPLLWRQSVIHKGVLFAVRAEANMPDDLPESADMFARRMKPAGAVAIDTQVAAPQPVAEMVSAAAPVIAGPMSDKPSFVIPQHDTINLDEVPANLSEGFNRELKAEDASDADYTDDEQARLRRLSQAAHDLAYPAGDREIK